MDRRPLGSSGLEVSRLSLGSWRTFERIPRADALAVMRAARELGFNFLDDALQRRDGKGADPDRSGAGVVASFVMAGGVLTGKYDAGQTGRAAAEVDDPRLAAARQRGRRLRELAAELGCSAAALAIAFALANPVVATVLFGATSRAQIDDNVTALGIDSATVERILEI
jgi:aryl-alcohol dehydrogenase-like predicted oxidoreductase